MIKKYILYNLITEKVGIELDIKELSEQIYNLINKDKKLYYKFDGSLFNVKVMHINSIRILILSDYSSFDASSSKITEKGFDIILNLNKNDIDVKAIHHELNHALKFYMVGKEKYIDKTRELKSYKMSRAFIKNAEVENFIDLVYYSDLEEVDSFISEAYYEIMSNFKKIESITETDFNKYFETYYKDTYIYNISKVLENYNVGLLKKHNSDMLVLFFNILNDKKDLLKVSKNSGSLKKILLNIRNIFNDNYYMSWYYNKIDKSVKIENLDEILKIYDKRFKKASKTIKYKLSKLYSLILEELKDENLIKQKKETHNS